MRSFMKKKLLSTLLLAGTLLIGSTVSAYAQDVSSDPLQPYEDRLEELSTELGTDLAIVAPEDGTIEDAIDFYSSMSMDEFDSYVKDAYEEAESLDVVTEEYVSEESSSLDVAPLASIAYYQKYFYNSGNTNNYLYVRAYVNSDTSKYTGEVYDIGSVQKSYPSYKCKSASYSFSSNKKTITCNYRVTKYLSSTLIETTTKNIIHISSPYALLLRASCISAFISSKDNSCRLFCSAERRRALKAARPSSKEMLDCAEISNGILRSLTTARAKILNAVEAFMPNSLHKLSN